MILVIVWEIKVNWICEGRTEFVIGVGNGGWFFVIVIVRIFGIFVGGFVGRNVPGTRVEFVLGSGS